VIRAVPLVVAAALGACSAQDGADGAATTSTAADGTTPAPGAEGAVPPPAPAAPTAGLRGQVSALTGDISGLNTRVTDMGTIVDLPADALFEYDKADLTPAAAAQLGKAADLIRRGPPGPIQVIGHTDSRGDDAYNQRLSEARARTVADWFGAQVGVRQRQFAVSGKGETAPIAPNETATGADDPAGRTKNRRVELVIPR